MTRTPRTTEFWWGRLPHWEVEDGRYFVTIHLAGAIPAEGRQRLMRFAEQFQDRGATDGEAWLRIQRLIFREMEKWLDCAQWNAKLRHPDVAAMVVDAIEHRQKRGDWNLVEYVVMPTHLHLFGEIGDRGLRATMEDFKRWTGHRAAEILNETSDRFWQREWFDHWSRSDEEDERIVAYIRDNPVKAGLVQAYTDWAFSSWRYRLIGKTAEVPPGRRDLLGGPS